MQTLGPVIYTQPPQDGEMGIKAAPGDGGL